MSGISITIVETGLVPTRISTLGVEFSQADQSTLLTILGAVLLYFLLAFLVYTVSDLWVHRVESYLSDMQFQEYTLDRIRSIYKEMMQIQREYSTLARKMEKSTDEIQQAMEGLRTIVGTMERTQERLVKTPSSKSRARKNLEDAVRLGEALIDNQNSAEKTHEEFEAVDSREQELRLRMNDLAAERKQLDALKGQFFIRRAGMIALFRMTFEIGLPVVISAYALWTVFRP